MDSRLNWGAHIHRVIDRGQQIYGILAPLMNDRSKLDPARRILLYKVVLRLMLIYAATLWATAANSHSVKLQTFQNWMLRWVVSAPRYIWYHKPRRRNSAPDGQSHGPSKPACVDVAGIRPPP
ncbi:hypothetical protein Trydic_g12526 [Trypoxylus dichotomus]